MRRVDRLLVRMREVRNDRAARVQGLKDAPASFDPILECLELHDLIAELVGIGESAEARVLDVSALAEFSDRLFEKVKEEIVAAGIIDRVVDDSVVLLKSVPANRFDDEKRLGMFVSAVRDGASTAVGLTALHLMVRILDWLDTQRKVSIRDRVGLAEARRERARQSELKAMRERARTKNGANNAAES